MFSLVDVKLKFSKLLTIDTVNTTVFSICQLTVLKYLFQKLQMYFIVGVLFPTTLLEFSSVLIKSRLACMQSI